jgi:hypothetical protein
MKVYLVYSDSHGLEGIYATEERAREIVEHISIVDYDYRTDEEIWDKNYSNGNELVYYKEEEVIG